LDEEVARDPLYRVNLGQPLDVPIRQNGIWTREFDSGSVAVNPGALDVTVTLSTGGPITVPAAGAVIVVADHVYTSGQ
jgi:hypothetical protein